MLWLVSGVSPLNCMQDVGSYPDERVVLLLSGASGLQGKAVVGGNAWNTFQSLSRRKELLFGVLDTSTM